jgi:uncharacterized protein YdeI (YjbR/CyaY-like superfamily)
MKMPLTFTTADRAEWRRWLEEHGSVEKEVWFVYYKRDSGKASLPYDDTVEEALCFGWIDSIIQKIDEEQYARKFNPRSNSQKWSASNLRRVQKLIAEGRMTEAGLRVIDPAILTKNPAELERVDDAEAFEQVREMLRRHPYAWANFIKLPPSHQKRYLGWISSAKQQATREKRLLEAVSYLDKGESMPMK